MRPVRLAPNLIDHFYVGGTRIAALRGVTTTSPRQPEEWIAATVARAGERTLGLACTVDGDLLRDLVAADPASWLGAGVHGARRGDEADTGILVKLLDAGQRLPVHAHPTRAFASQHLSCPYGKTEAWFVLDATDDAAVYLGWREDIDAGELARRRDAQDSSWMLSRMHRVDVRPGDGILVPAGTVHAIGQGVFLVEVQEPTDFSIVLEWSATTSTREESHLGIGFDAVMPAVSHDRLSQEDLAALTIRTDPAARLETLTRCLPEAGDPFFRLDVVAPVDTVACLVPAGFAAVVVLDGVAELTTDGVTHEIGRGDVLAIPAACGEWQVLGDVRLLVARPGDGWPATLDQRSAR